MNEENKGISAEGRTPPPTKSQFQKGRSGNPAGRPKGSNDRTRSNLTRKVAEKKRKLLIEGKPRKLKTLDLLILKAKAMAASGHPGAFVLINWIRSQTEPSEAKAEGGFLIVPTPLTPEEFMAKEEIRNAGKVEPGTEINIEHEEYIKAVRGEASPLGEALRAFSAKYGAGPAR
jgi:hypothetical protein